MQEYSFNKIITKSIEIEKDSDKRIFTGYITAEIVDKQGEFIFVDEMFPILEKLMKINPVMSEIHTNRITGKLLKIEKSTIPETDIPAIKCKCEVYKSEGVTLYDRVWEKIVNKEYRGLSIGGASKTREHFIKNGRPTILLKDLEIYEVAICPTPANSLAKIEWVNEFAKSDDGIQKGTFEKKVTQCDNLQCVFEKGLNMDTDIDIDNKKPRGENTKLDIYKDLINLQMQNSLLKLLR